MITHKERYEFPKDRGIQESTAERNSYICAKLDCLLRRYPYYDQHLLIFSIAMKSEEQDYFKKTLFVNNNY